MIDSYHTDTEDGDTESEEDATIITNYSDNESQGNATVISGSDSEHSESEDGNSQATDETDNDTEEDLEGFKKLAEAVTNNDLDKVDIVK